jgi:hypothetical protein
MNAACTTKGRSGTEGGEETLGVSQCGVDLLLDFWRQMTQISCPGMAATGACHGYDGDALCDEPAAVVIALGTPNPKGTVRVRHMAATQRQGTS